MANKTKVTSSGQKEIENVEKQLQAFESNIKEMTVDNLNKAPQFDQEPQTQLSKKDIEKSKDLYLKPAKTISSKEKFNEDYRKDFNFSKEYVHFVAENKEVIGETIKLWTKPFAGMPAEYWEVPVNKPLWGPRYLAEQIKAAKYHAMVMNDVPTGAEGGHTFYGSMAVKNTIQRLDAHPVSDKKSFFTGTDRF